MTRRLRQLGADETRVKEPIARDERGIVTAENDPQDVPGEGLPGCARTSVGKPVVGVC